MSKILRINMTDLTLREEPLPAAYRYLGGRALTSRIVCDEVDPQCDPLGPANKLVLAPGQLSGTTASSSSRLSVGCKSPLTGGIKEANAGGQSGMKLAQLGYAALIVEGQPRDRERLYLLILDAEGGRLESADHLRGLGTQATGEHLFERFTKKIGVSAIGPTGERLMNLAGICNNDPEGRLGRINARGGVGAVMGSKGLKAIAYVETKYNPPPTVHPDRWKASVKDYHLELRTQPSTNEAFPLYGTAITLEKVNKLGGLPIRNFSRGADPEALKIGGQALFDGIKARGGAGMTTHSCMSGCTIRCSNVWADEQGNEIASSMEFETNALMGLNLEIFNFDDIARFTKECNDLGVDTVETGGVLGIAMEAGLAPWGSAEGVMNLLQEIRQGTPTGRLLGRGGVQAARELGIQNVAAVKGQMMAAYDPRAIKGNGVTYATSPMGADHTAANTIVMPTDHRDPAGKVELSRNMQIMCIIQDSLGYCVFNRAVWLSKPEVIVEMFNSRNGADWTADQLLAWAQTVLRDEIRFNRAAGLGPETDRLPEYMRNTPLPPYDLVFDVPEDELDRIWEGVL